MLAAALNESLIEGQKRLRQQVANEILEQQIKIVTATYSHAAAYTNLVLLGGYAGFFGLWQLAKDHLSRPQVLWSALLILISLVFFIAFEVTKSTVQSVAILKKAKVLESAGAKSNPEQALAALQAFDQAYQRSMSTFMRYWAFTVFICASTAIGGVSIMAYAFVSGILK